MGSARLHGLRKLLLPGLDKLDPLSTIITTLDIANDERVAGEQDEILENFKW